MLNFEESDTLYKFERLYFELVAKPMSIVKRAFQRNFTKEKFSLSIIHTFCV
jgi:hypothetical protein